MLVKRCTLSICVILQLFQRYRAAEVSQVKCCIHQVRSSSVLLNTLFKATELLQLVKSSVA